MGGCFLECEFFWAFCLRLRHSLCARHFCSPKTASAMNQLSRWRPVKSSLFSDASETDHFSDASQSYPSSMAPLQVCLERSLAGCQSWKDRGMQWVVGSGARSTKYRVRSGWAHKWAGRVVGGAAARDAGQKGCCEGLVRWTEEGSFRWTRSPRLRKCKQRQDDLAKSVRST
jgi:hypothetical protein